MESIKAEEYLKNNSVGVIYGPGGISLTGKALIIPDVKKYGDLRVKEVLEELVKEMEGRIVESEIHPDELQDVWNLGIKKCISIINSRLEQIKK